VTAPTALDRLHKKTRRVAERHLAGDEHVVTVFVGRSKQALVVTDRQILIVKAGSMAGAGSSLKAKVASFSFANIAAINVHTGPGMAALEVVSAGSERSPKPKLRTAYQQPNWLPCRAAMGESPLIGELRAYVRSDGRSQSARAALSDLT
jgi:hypothetical protein